MHVPLHAIAHKWQEVSIHGSQYTAEKCWIERQDPGYTENIGYGAIPQNKNRLLHLHKFQHDAETRQSESEPIETTFELNETLYAKALISATDEVYLWLGANVMLAYPIDEAVGLLESKLSSAQEGLTNCEEDLDFLREQITVDVKVVAHGCC